MSFDGRDLYMVVEALREIRGAGGRRALLLQNEELKRAAAVREWEQAKARIRQGMTGTVQAKEDEALLGTTAEHEAVDVAKAAETYAKAMCRDHESDQSNLQTQARLIEADLRLAGTGRTGEP